MVGRLVVMTVDMLNVSDGEVSIAITRASWSFRFIKS